MTFLLLEPVLNNWLYPEEEPQTVTFPQEKDEMLPEDMLTEGETGTQTESETETAEQVTTQIAAEETPASEVETAESASTENPQKAYLLSIRQCMTVFIRYIRKPPPVLLRSLR